MRSFDWIAPEALDGVVKAAAEKGAVIKAGGVDLLDRVKNRIEAPKMLVSLGRVPGLAEIADDDPLRIGARVTLAEIAASEVVRARAPQLAEACVHVATPQVRNMATLGGNLAQQNQCWYFRSEHDVCKRKGGTVCFALDGENEHHALFGNKVCASVHASTVAPMLIALGAAVAIKNQKGTKEVLLEDFFLAPEKDVRRENVLLPGEMITEVRIPRASLRTGYLKQQAKESFDWPLAVAAVAIELDGGVCKKASIILGAVAPVPWRARAAEAALLKKAPSPEVIAQAAKAATQGAHPLAQNGYRVGVLEVVVRRALERALEVKS
jgi:xanthine dehydrogenase YagS FAD-binding subunit